MGTDEGTDTNNTSSTPLDTNAALGTVSKVSRESDRGSTSPLAPNTTDTSPPTHPICRGDESVAGLDQKSNTPTDRPRAVEGGVRGADGANPGPMPVPSLLGFDLGRIRARFGAASDWPDVVALGGPDAHVVVASPAVAARLAQAIEASSSRRVVLAARKGRLAIRIGDMPFAHVIDGVVPDNVAAALHDVEVVGHDLIRTLAAMPSTPTRTLDTRILAGLVHHATRIDDPDLGLAACLVRYGIGTTDEASADARILARETVAVESLRNELDLDVRNLKLEKVVDLEHFALPALVDATRTGLPFDRVGWAKMVHGEQARCRALHDSLRLTLGGIRLDYAPAVGFKLRALGIAVAGTRTFELLPHRAHNVVRDLIDHRRVSAFVSDLGPSVLARLDGDDRLRATYDPVGAATGRMSTREPNVMGLPRETRRFVGAPEGRTFVDADYNAIELRIIAAQTLDGRLCAAFKQGVDVHRSTAALLSGKLVSDVSKDERQRAKAVNFGLSYGMSARGLKRTAIESYGIELSFHEADAIRATFLAAYSNIAAWHGRLRRQTPMTHPTTTTTIGRLRRVPAAPPGDPSLPFRIYANSRIQGVAADGMKRALGLLALRLPQYDAHIVATVHDQVLVEVREEFAETVKEVVAASMKEGMEHYVKSVPIEVEARITKTWG